MSRHSGEIDVQITRIYARSKQLAHGFYLPATPQLSTACLIKIAACFDLHFPSSLLLTEFATCLFICFYTRLISLL